MADHKLKSLRGAQRRRFLKVAGAAAAALGLERSGLLNYLADEGGHGLAEAATLSGRRALGVTCGNGVFAWMQQLWMSPNVAITAATEPGFGGTSAYLYTAQRGYTGPAHVVRTGSMTDTGKTMVYSPDAPWMIGGQPKYPVTALIAGNDETHTEFPESSAIVSAGASLAATVGSIQALDSTALVPVLGIDPLKYGTAQGAPDVTTAPSAEGIVDLFNSAASKMTLSRAEDQELFETYYKAFLGLRRASTRSTWQPQLQITKDAARLIGLNFSAALTPTAADLELYGLAEMTTATMTAMQRQGLENFGRTLITVARAFKLGLTNSAMVGLSPGPTSEQTFTDPHVTFDSANNMMQARNVTKHLGKILTGFYADLETMDDPESVGDKLSDTTVFFTWGDTPHTPLRGSNWPDATPMDSNWLYIMDPKKSLNEGWYGGVNADGTVAGWDPTTGAEVLGKPATQTSTAAGAAVAYAVAKGNMNVVSQYYVGEPIDGVIKA